MSKKNPLSVWSYPYKKTYYLTHPWKWWHDTYWNIRNWIHRANKGFAYTDCWNFCDYYPRVGAEALRYLARHNSGYPGYPPWETPEKWREHLNEMASKLQHCADFLDSECETDERNEYQEAFYEMCDRTHREYKDEKGNTVWTSERTPEDEELAEKYFKRCEELNKVDRRYAREVFGFLGENLGRYWD